MLVKRGTVVGITFGARKDRSNHAYSSRFRVCFGTLSALSFFSHPATRSWHPGRLLLTKYLEEKPAHELEIRLEPPLLSFSAWSCQWQPTGTAAVTCQKSLASYLCGRPRHR